MPQKTGNECTEEHNEKELGKAIARLRLRIKSFKFGTIGVQFVVHDGAIVDVEFVDKEKVRV